jgi:hypothetical protein
MNVSCVAPKLFGAQAQEARLQLRCVNAVSGLLCVWLLQDMLMKEFEHPIDYDLEAALPRLQAWGLVNVNTQVRWHEHACVPSDTCHQNVPNLCKP